MNVNKSYSQFGGISIFFVILIPIILIFSSYLYFNNARALLRTQLQTAADAASLASAKVLCSRSECYRDAILAAIEVLKTHSAHGGGFNNSLAISINDLSDSSNPTWVYEDRNLEVKIERGIWIENTSITDDYFECAQETSEASCFQSMENGWQSTHPGVPVHVVANSIRTTIKRKNVGSLLDFGLSASSDETISSVAIAGEVEPVEIAPFAIPVCSILDMEGEYQFKDVCRGDRIFTSLDRYLPDEAETEAFGLSVSETLDRSGVTNYTDSDWTPYYEDYENLGLEFTDLMTIVSNVADRNKSEARFKMGTKPTFFYGPCDPADPNAYSECNINRILNPTMADFKEDTDNIFGWGNYAYENFADHYGIVGNVSPVVGEEGLVNSLAASITSKIGDRFYPLASGFTESASGDAIWSKIINSSVRSVDTDIGNLNNINGEIAFSTNFSANFSYAMNEVPYAPESDGSTDREHRPPVDDTYELHAGIDEQEQNEPKDSPFHVSGERFPYKETKSLRRDVYTAGLCNSRRMELGCIPKGETTFQSIDSMTDPNDCELDVSDFYDTASMTLKGEEILKNIYGKMIQLSAKLKIDDSEDNVWQIKVPIVADPRSTESVSASSIYSCEGIEGQEVEPVMNSTTELVVVGYVNVNIFDLDIGDLPTDAKELKAPFKQEYDIPNNVVESVYYGVKSGPTYTMDRSGAPGIHCDGALQCRGGTVTGQGDNIVIPAIPTGLPDTYQTDYPYPFFHNGYNPNFWYRPESFPFTYTGPNPWNFQVDGKPTACNMVRARIDCSSSFIPSSQNISKDGLRVARLVN